MKSSQLSFWKQIIHREEIRGAERQARFKKLHQFQWGLDHLGLDPNCKSPAEALNEYTKKAFNNSSGYFVPEVLSRDAYTLKAGVVTFPSSIQSFDKENNIAKCHFFPKRNSDRAILVVPHWNSSGGNYDRLCRLLNMMNVSALRVVLPYHEERAGGAAKNYSPGLPSGAMVSANIGLTLQALRQAVQDTISAVNWLNICGYEHVGILGASIGSCVAFIAAAHDMRIKGFFGNLFSSFFGDVVWTGISTVHIMKSLEGHITLEELRKYWLPNSPIAFVDSLLQHNPKLKILIISARYDYTFKFYLTEKVLTEFERKGVRHNSVILPCGHYTLGKYWFKYVVAYYLLRFVRSFLN